VRPRRLSDEALGCHRPRNGEAAPIEDGGEPVGRHVLLPQQRDERLRLDQGSHHVARRALALDGNADGDDRPAERGADEQIGHGFTAGGRRLGNVGRAERARQRAAERARGIHELLARGGGQHDGRPAVSPLALQGPPCLGVEAGHIAMVETLGARENFERGDRRHDLAVDGKRERAGGVPQPFLGTTSIGLPEQHDHHRGEQHDRNDGHQHQRNEVSAKLHRPAV